MANGDVKKALDSNGLLYFGKEYYKKLQGKFVAIESGKALSTNDYTTAEKEKLDGIEAGAEVNVVEVVKVNGTALEPNGNKEVDLTVVEGTNNGTVKVNGTDVAVHGLGSAAFTESSAYDAAGAAAAVLGAATDQSSANTVYGVKAALNEALGNGGSVASQIEAALDGLDASQGADASGVDPGLYVVSGVDITQSNGVITGVSVDSVAVDPAGAAATAEQNAKDYADSLASDYDAAGAAAAVMGDSEDTAADMTVYGVKAALDDALGDGGSVSSQITTAINALDSADTAVENQFVTSVSEADGIITVTRARPSAANISVAALDGIAAGDLQTVLGALEDAIDAGGTGSVVTVEEVTQNLSAGILKAYQIKQGESVKGTINIPKDFLVKSGEVREATAEDSGFEVGEKILDFEINTVGDDETSEHILISVADLVDAYTGGNGINVSATNEISAVVDNTSESFLTVGANGLKLAGVQDAIDSASGDAQTYVDNKVAALDADVDASGTPAHSGTFVVSGITEVDGVITGVDSVEVEAAGAAATAQAAVEAQIAALDADLDATGTAQHAGTFVISGVTQVDGKITAVDSTEVEAAGAAAAALTSAQSYADNAATAAQTAAENYADTVAAAVAVTADVTTASANYVTASASGKNVTVGLTSDAISDLVAASTAIQSLSKVDGNYVTLAISADGTARTITVTDSLIGTALAGKADKVANSTAGNLAALDANGNLVDSMVSAASLTVTYMTNTEVQEVVDACFAPASGS